MSKLTTTKSITRRTVLKASGLVALFVGCSPLATQQLSAIAISAGAFVATVLLSDKTVRCWGDNRFGQFGNSKLTGSTKSVKVDTLTDIVAISAGVTHTLALDSQGRVWSWGQGDAGKLGTVDHPIGNYPEPTKLTDLSNVVAISAGAEHSLAVGSDGAVWAWGDNSHGQLGNGDLSYQVRPFRLADLKDIVKVAAGFSHSLALSSDGWVWSWGENGAGELGDGTTRMRLSPGIIPQIKKATTIVAGNYNSAAIQQDMTAWAWGNNYNGQIGLGSISATPVPTLIPGSNGAVEVALGAAHAIMRFNDGTIMSVGDSANGKLGIGMVLSLGSPPPKLQLVPVNSVKNVIAIDAESEYSMALLEDGSIWTWGENSSGVLGNGTYRDESTPVRVNGF